MALVLLFSNKYSEYYNCSFYNYQDVPYPERSSIFFGCLFILTFVAIWIFYVPCIIAMCKKDLIKHSCYKIMIYVAILDLNKSIYVGLYPGIINITGNVYCHWPTFAYIMGVLNSFAWKVQSIATVLLAFNRCIEAFNGHLSQTLFNGKKLAFWMLLPLVWGGKDLLWGPPGLYNPILFTLTYNPHEGYFHDSLQYADPVILYNNVFVAVAIFTIYSAVGIYIVAKTKQKTGIIKHTKVFGQILIISFCFLFTMTAFMITQFIRPPSYLNPWISYSFLILDGLPAMVYLTMNKTIRQSVYEICGFTSLQKNCNISKTSTWT